MSSRDMRSVYGRHRALLAIMGLGFCVRLAVLLLYLSTHNWQGEIWEYEYVANNLLEGHGFTATVHNTVYRSWVVPVFPLLCYALHLIGGQGLALYYAVHLSVATGIIALTYLLARHGLSERIALLAALLVALEPGLVIYHSYKVDPGALATFLLLLGIYCFIRSIDSSSWRQATATGLAFGAGMLTRPDIVAGYAALLSWAFLERKRPKVVLRLALPILAATLVVLIPWVVRNYSIHGEMLVTGSASSEWMWRGNNPNSTGTSVTAANEGQFEAAPDEFRRRVDTSSEIENYRLFREEALRFIKQDPMTFVRRCGIKLWYFIWFSSSYAGNYYGWLPAQLPNVYKLIHAVLLGFVFVGAWSVLNGGPEPARRTSVYFISVVLGVALTHAVGYVEGRHRVIVMPLLLIFAASGVGKVKAVYDQVRAARQAQFE